jgi:glycosyltransferase involved in cell wall biosynthesis
MHLFHVFPGFGYGGTQLRMVRILNALGGAARHTILPLDGVADAKDRLSAGVRAEIVAAPPRSGFAPYAVKLREVVKAQRPDLLLTYNWGAMDAVIGACLGPVCPVVHNECGFGPDEAVRMKQRRVLTRRLVLRRIHTTVVTSRNLLEICRDQFKLPPGKTRWIRTGVDTEVFRPDGSRDWRDEIGVQKDELLFAFLGALRPEKNLELLLRGFAAAGTADAKLVFIGEGSCRPELERLAAELGIERRVIFAGRTDRPAACLAALDVFAMSSSTEQTSNAMLEAMATGLPIVTTDVGDSRELLGKQGGFVTPAGDAAAYAAALRAMGDSVAVRRDAGAANRRRAVEQYSNDRMVREYGALYSEAAGMRFQNTIEFNA